MINETFRPIRSFLVFLERQRKKKRKSLTISSRKQTFNLDDLASSLVSGIKEAKEDQKKQKKNEEKLIEQLDSIIDVIENTKRS